MNCIVGYICYETMRKNEGMGRANYDSSYLGSKSKTGTVCCLLNWVMRSVSAFIIVLHQLLVKS